MENLAYCNKNEWYYNVEKSIIYPLIPEGPHKILDLGCGTGRLGKKLLELNKAKTVIGVEIFKDAAQEAEKNYERVYHGDIEKIDLNYDKYFDFVICGDILEHLKDPWTVLKRIYKWLKINGFIIVVIPNIRYWRIIMELLFKAKWDYADSGILDKTHLRFFTSRTFIKMLETENFKIYYHEMIIYGRKKRLCNTLTFSRFKDFLGSQTLIKAQKDE